jgi:peptidoglycan/LPS O-acetylase OafA/YrhL
MNSHSTALSHPKYRADIDGLRAIAVLSVVAYHAFPAYVRGGFIGVDIFFVISGFLISTIMFENLERGTFSFAEFYARRVKRIFPALLTVFVACAVFGWFALLGDEYKQLGKHIAAGSGFISNFALWNESGYFDNTADTKPLLHLWSLGIEEQFYLAWPLTAWTAYKTKRRVPLIMMVVIAGSFALNVFSVHRDATAAFYSPLTRFWELIAGGLLAWNVLHNREWLEKLPTGYKSALSLAGIGLLGLGVLFIDARFAFPGWWALLPVLGATMIILAGAQAWGNRTVLAMPPAVWFGLISYPLYLWHWPLLSFAWILESQAPSRGIRAAAVVAAIVLAWITYRLIERPIRYGGQGRPKTIGLLFAMAVIGSIGFATYRRDGFAFRKNAAFQSAIAGDIGHKEFLNYLSTKFHRCTFPRAEEESRPGHEALPCLQSQPGDDVDIALVGDSHAEHTLIGIAEALPSRNVAFYPINGLPRVGDERFQIVYDRVASQPTVKSVVLINSWFGRIGEVPVNSSLKAEVAKVAEKFLQAGKTVYVMEDVPSFSFAPEKCKGIRWPSTRTTCVEARAAFTPQIKLFESDLRTIARDDPRIKLIETRRYFCDDSACKMTDGSRLLFRDSNHLNIIGSQYLGGRIVQDEVELSRQ